MSLFNQALLLLVVAAVPAAITGIAHPQAPHWRADVLPAGHVTMATVSAWPKQPLWIDARVGDADRTNHIPGAQPLTLSGWDQQIPAVIAAWSPGRPVVVYCDVQTCQDSGRVAELLRQDYALPDVHVLHGGWAAWLARQP